MDGSSFQAVCEVLKEKHDRPGAIRRACGVVEDCLITNKDNLRGFFEYCFPLLIKKIFGYDDREASWLFTVATESRADDFNAVIQLLAPDGPLFTALHAADADAIIQFLFPPERLPAHTQELLRVPAGLRELNGWPQYKGRLRLDNMGRCQVHLNMFEYLMFWAAFYVLRGSRSTDKGKAATSSRGRGLIQSGARRLLGGSSSSGGGSSGALFSEPVINPRHPYFRLLRLYLEAYLPRPKAQGGRSTAGGGGSGPCGGGVSAASAGGALGGLLGGSLGALSGLTANTAYAAALSASPGEVLLSVLLEFWLTDAGEPLPPELQQPPAAAAGAGGTGSSPQAGFMQQGMGAGLSSQVSGNMAAAAAAAAGGWAGGSLAGMGAADAVLGSAALSGGWGTVGGAAAAGGAGRSIDPMQAAVLSGAVSPAAGGYGGQAGGWGFWGGGAAAGMSSTGGGGAAAGSTLQMYSYQPPSEDLLMALTLLFKYVHVIEPPRQDTPAAPAQASSAWLPQSPVATLPLPSGRLSAPLSSSHPLLSSPAFSPPVQAVGRKLYRLLRRTFAQWQPSSSASLSKVIGLWLVVLAPWRSTSYSDTLALQQTVDSLRAAADSRAQRIAAGGSGSVASGGLAGGAGGAGIFGGGMLSASAAAKLNRWGSEMVHVAATLGHVGQHGEGGDYRGGNGQPAKYTRAWRAHVWAHLPFYTILLPAFLELCYSQTAYSSKMALNNVYRVLKVFIESGDELVQEIRLAEEAYTQHLKSGKMRRTDGDMADVLPWLAEQAQDWEAAAAAGAPAQPPLLPDTRYRMFDLERGGAPSCMQSLLAAAERQNINGREKLHQAALAVLPIDQLPTEERTVAAAHVDGRDLPKAGSWRAVGYQGDSMLRPIASYEVAWLARLLVGLSTAFNNTLGLSATPAPPSEEPPETIVQEVLGWVRRHGWRLNLRFLAEKQTLAWLLGLALLARFFWALFSSEGGAFSYEGYEEELAARQAAHASSMHHAQQQPRFGVR